MEYKALDKDLNPEDKIKFETQLKRFANKFKTILRSEGHDVEFGEHLYGDKWAYRKELNEWLDMHIERSKKLAEREGK